MGSELQLQILVVFIEEESFHHLIVPEFEECFSRFAARGCWVVEVRCFYIDKHMTFPRSEAYSDGAVIKRFVIPSARNAECLLKAGSLRLGYSLDPDIRQ